MTDLNIPDDIAEFIEVIVTRDIDGVVTLAFLETQPGLGKLRLRLNDMVIYDGDPETHAHTPCQCSTKEQ